MCHPLNLVVICSVDICLLLSVIHLVIYLLYTVNTFIYNLFRNVKTLSIANKLLKNSETIFFLNFYHNRTYLLQIGLFIYFFAVLLNQLRNASFSIRIFTGFHEKLVKVYVLLWRMDDEKADPIESRGNMVVESSWKGVRINF